MDIRFNCPRCNQHLSVDESGAGMTVNCPSCNDSLEIPRSETLPPPPVPPKTHTETATGLKLPTARCFAEEINALAERFAG
jgi:uncharacterized protein YbaR (Trm112 family)